MGVGVEVGVRLGVWKYCGTIASSDGDPQGQVYRVEREVVGHG